MSDQIIDAAMARSIQADAQRVRLLYGWIVMYDLPDHPGKYVARFATEHPSVYVMLADTLGEIQSMLPPGLEQSPRQNGDPSEVIEVWFSPTS